MTIQAFRGVFIDILPMKGFILTFMRFAQLGDGFLRLKSFRSSR